MSHALFDVLKFSYVHLSSHKNYLLIGPILTTWIILFQISLRSNMGMYGWNRVLFLYAVSIPDGWSETLTLCDTLKCPTFDQNIATHSQSKGGNLGTQFRIHY